MSRGWPVRYHVPRHRSPWPAVVAGVVAVAVLVPAQVAVVTAAARGGSSPATAATAAAPGPTPSAPAAPGPSGPSGPSSPSGPAATLPPPVPAEPAGGTLVVAFGTGEVDVAADDVARLERLAEEVRGEAGVRLVVTGRAEPSGDAVLEEQLSLARAEAVVAVLVAAGVPAARVEPVAAGADGAGGGGPGSRAEVARAVSDR